MIAGKQKEPVVMMMGVRTFLALSLGAAFIAPMGFSRYKLFII